MEHRRDTFLNTSVQLLTNLRAHALLRRLAFNLLGTLREHHSLQLHCLGSQTRRIRQQQARVRINLATRSTKPVNVCTRVQLQASVIFQASTFSPSLVRVWKVLSSSM